MTQKIEMISQTRASILTNVCVFDTKYIIATALIVKRSLCNRLLDATAVSSGGQQVLYIFYKVSMVHLNH